MKFWNNVNRKKGQKYHNLVCKILIQITEENSNSIINVNMITALWILMKNRQLSSPSICAESTAKNHTINTSSWTSGLSPTAQLVMRKYLHKEGKRVTRPSSLLANRYFLCTLGWRAPAQPQHLPASGNWRCFPSGLILFFSHFHSIYLVMEVQCWSKDVF